VKPNFYRVDIWRTTRVSSHIPTT